MVLHYPFADVDNARVETRLAALGDTVFGESRPHHGQRRALLLFLVWYQKRVLPVRLRQRFAKSIRSSRKQRCSGRFGEQPLYMFDESFDLTALFFIFYYVETPPELCWKPPFNVCSQREYNNPSPTLPQSFNV